MELFAGFNAEELAMMQELLRLLLEDDDPVAQQPTPRTSARQESQALYEGLTSPKRTGGMMVNEFGDYPWGMTAQTGIAWNAAPPAMPPAPQLATTASRTRTRSNFASDDEPLHKRGRIDVTPAMRVPVNRIPLSEGPRAVYHPYY
ncbi:Kinetochore protein NUF2 protein [Phytophthora cinnamomi]|uniref:Kinetochore protein NUF2 protein n=1 Tax=Phytophthora cinnamomi TaxID=4785 RepID=UPI003559ABB7|nr:Kinetochore protein NUF2 protein [Phytophthora cinnamomi]